VWQQWLFKKTGGGDKYITFCCSEARVTAKGSAAMEAKVAASNAVGLLGGLAAGFFAVLVAHSVAVAG
jgi:hypothetical protein